MSLTNEIITLGHKSDEEAYARVLDVMAKSPLADIPWPLITPLQVARTLRGERVYPTEAQKAGALRAERESSPPPKPKKPRKTLVPRDRRRVSGLLLGDLAKYLPPKPKVTLGDGGVG